MGLVEIDVLIEELESVSSDVDLRVWHDAHLGKQGTVSEMMRSIGLLPPADRREAGMAANRFKNALVKAYDTRAEMMILPLIDGKDFPHRCFNCSYLETYEVPLLPKNPYEECHECIAS